MQVSGLNTASPVEAILDKEGHTLEELLDEDELIQECKSLNARLTAFLSKKETVEALLLYLTIEAPLDAEPKRMYKYPFTACEIFCCEVESIFNTLLEEDDLLAMLFSIVERDDPPNAMLAGYFSRVMGALLLRRTADVSAYLQKNVYLLEKMVKHVDITSIAEVLVRLAGADDQRSFLPTAALDWLAETSLLALLTEGLGHDSTPEAQANVAEILAAIARSPSSPLTSKLASVEFLNGLVSRALEPNDRGALTHALNLCIALLEPLPPHGGHHDFGGGDPISSEALDLQAKLRHIAIGSVAQSVDKLVAMLEDPNCKELPTTYGMIKPAVGEARLKAVDLLASLLRAGDAQAERAVIESNGVQRCMELFLKYPFNNVLHNGCVQLLIAFDTNGSDVLVKFLLEECHLPHWLASAPEQVTPMTNPEDRFASQRRPLRAGYLGQITQLGSRLVDASLHNTFIAEILEKCPSWKPFVEKQLEPRLALSNIYSWQCGRPGLGNNGVGVSEGDMYSSELNSVNIFASATYQRYTTAFADDEEEEEEEDTSGEEAEEKEGEEGQHGDENARIAVTKAPVRDELSDLDDDAVLLNDDDEEELIIEEVQRSMESSLHLREPDEKERESSVDAAAAEEQIT